MLISANEIELSTNGMFSSLNGYLIFVVLFLSTLYLED